MRRRDLMLGAGATIALTCVPSACSTPRTPTPRAGTDPFAAIEASVGGRVGVFAIETGTERHVGRREDERFAMCSTFKWALVAAVLARIDHGQLSLDERVSYGLSDLLEYAPTTSEHVAEGAMSIEALAEAAITNSDNTAANLLLAKVDGPHGLTQFLRQLGDPVTRLDRNEPALNANVRGDVRDTTTPRAMAGLMRAVLCGDALSPASRDRLVGWLKACKTGLERVRAGAPVSWVVGDKTGTGLQGAVNDVAILFPPQRAPILLAAYMSDGDSPMSSLNAAHAEIGRVIAKELAMT
jgi:beta-lactamase class A